jgi:hypothetical protein
LCPSPSSSHHHSRIPSLTPSIAVCALPRLLPSTCRCCPSMSAVVSIPSAVPLPSAVSTSAVRPRPFPLTYHIVVVPLTSLAHVASALIFCPNLAHHTSVLIRRSRRVAPRPSAMVIIALLFVLVLSAWACASPSVKRQVYELPSAPVYFLLELRGRLRQWRIVARGAASSGRLCDRALLRHLHFRHIRGRVSFHFATRFVASSSSASRCVFALASAYSFGEHPPGSRPDSERRPPVAML